MNITLQFTAQPDITEAEEIRLKQDILLQVTMAAMQLLPGRGIQVEVIE